MMKRKRSNRIPLSPILKRVKLYFDLLKRSTDAYLYVEDVPSKIAMLSPNLVQDFDLPNEVMENLHERWAQLIHPEERVAYETSFRESVEKENVFDWSDSKAMAQFIHNAVKSEPIVLKSEGNQQFSYTYAPDAVSAILTIMLNGNNGEAYNVANVSEVHSLKEIATYLARLSGQNVTYDVAETTEKKGYSSANRAILKTEKLEKLGWRNRYTMYEAL